MNQNKDMRFQIVRTEFKEIEGKYTLNGERCPNCGQRNIVVGDDKTRKYCSNGMGNAFILE